MKYLIPLVLLIIFLSCSGKNDLPAGVLQPGKMQEVFWDYIRADVYTTNFTTHDSARNEAIENLKLQDRIFKMHHVTKEEFYKSYMYYSNHKELMTAIIDSMVAKQKRIRPKSIPLNKDTQL